MLAAKLSMARAVGSISRRSGRGATSLPGRVLMRLDGHAIARLGARLAGGSIVLSATNGKTTTAAMAASILKRARREVVHNRAGANMAGGIASTLLAAAGPGATMAGDLGLFEVDEFFLAGVVDELSPRLLVLGNLFRDQLDRYGELESIADRWAQTVQRHPPDQLGLALNADDPLVADLGRDRGGVLYFGVDDDRLALEGLAHASDSKHCRRCGSPYRYSAVYLGHLGHYECPVCGARRPTPSVVAENVVLQGVRSSRFALRTPDGRAEVHLPLPGLYNVYNALAAAALALSLEVSLSDVVSGLEATRPAFGRSESVRLGERELAILLVKNPAGANEVLRTLALEPGQHDLLGILNDNAADGRDVSWIWDADFETVASRLRRVTCAGTRAPELALRLKYAGVEPESIRVEADLARAVDGALADLPPVAPRSEPAITPPVYALPTYTAMLALRELLRARGQVSSSWS